MMDDRVEMDIQSRVTYSVQTAAEYLAEVVEGDIGTKHGKTAFFWAVMAVIQTHTKPKEEEK